MREGPQKGSFADDPRLGKELFDLLDAVFPGLRQGVEEIRALGAPWESVSTPFVWVEGGRVVSHVGVIGISLVLLGRITRVGSVHAVATHPRCRRRGYYGRLMAEVLRDCGDRHQTLILTTENPEYYEPFGFRAVPEHCFKVTRSSPGGGGGMRRIDTREAGDAALLRRLLKTRAPVSQVVGVVDELAVFIFNEARRPLYYAEDLDVIVCMELEGRRLKLFDVVGPDIPPLAALLERTPHPIEEVTVYFAPDRLAADATATPNVLDHGGPSYLMVRGPFAAEEEAFTLPRSART